MFIPVGYFRLVAGFETCVDQCALKTAGGMNTLRVLLVREVWKLLFLSLAPGLGLEGIDSGFVLIHFSGENIHVVDDKELERQVAVEYHF